MFCVPIPNTHQQILNLLRNGPRHQTDLEQLPATPLDQEAGRALAWANAQFARWTVR
jgi:uncharacterized protein YgbK (DUF1537 family)